MENTIPPLEVASEQYFRELKPYHDKVYQDYQPLNTAELDDLTGIKDNLSRMYPADMKGSKIQGYLLGILDMNDVILRAKKEEELEGELRRLGLIDDSSLTPPQREQTEARIREIKWRLYPEYHPVP